MSKKISLPIYSKIISKLQYRTDISVKTSHLKYKHHKFDFLEIKSKDIQPTDKIFLIRAGIHGDEISGPSTLEKHLNQIIDYIHKNGLKIIIYPLGNPSGYFGHQRYNIENDLGTVGNNDFVRYELNDGKLTDDIFQTEDFIHWHRTSDPKLSIKLPLETILMNKLLDENPLTQIKACLDLHQDYITTSISPSAYHFSYGDLSVYQNIITKLETIIPMMKNYSIDAGSNNNIAIKSDQHGFIIRHDGTLTDLFWRLGCKYCVTTETIGKTPLNIAIQTNLIWIQGIVKLICADK